MRPYRLFTQLYQTTLKTISDGVTDLASSIAFFICFSIFPFTLALLSAAGMWMDNDEVQHHLHKVLVSTVPKSAELIMAQVAALMQARGSMGIAGILALLWSASAGFGAISRAINRAQGKPSPHNYVVSRLSYFAMAMAVSALLLVVVAISGVVELLFANDQHLMAVLGLDYGTLSRIGFGLTTFGILVVVFALIYRSAPNETLSWRHIWPGAILAALFNEGAKFGFLWYLGHAAKLDMLFGSLTAIMTLLMWFYIVGIGLIAGFEFNLVLAADSGKKGAVR